MGIIVTHNDNIVKVAMISVSQIEGNFKEIVQLYIGVVKFVILSRFEKEGSSKCRIV